MTRFHPVFAFIIIGLLATSSRNNHPDKRNIPDPHFADKDFNFSDLTEYKGKFYGLCKRGGIKSCGTLFEWDPVANLYTKRFDFNDSSGKFPQGQLTLQNGKLYGVAIQGGKAGERSRHGAGTIFEFDPATNIFTRKIAFDEKEGYADRTKDLYLKDGKFYGILGGGTEKNRYGSIFEWDPVTNRLQTKLAFDSTDAGYPQGSLILRNGKFYGIVGDKYKGSEVSKYGGIFEWDPVTNAHAIKLEFSWDNGTTVSRGLTLFRNKFYGLCIKSTGSAGVLFEWDPDTNIYTKKYEFTSHEEGGFPFGCLSIYRGKLYGMTNSYDKPGIIFEWDPEKDSLTKKVTLDPESEICKNGTLTLKNGKFYGLFYLAEYGGFQRKEDRILFEWDPVKNTFKKKKILGKED